MNYFVILYLAIILLLCIIYQPYHEYYDDSDYNLVNRINENDKLINNHIQKNINNTGIDVNSYNNGLNMFDIREIDMNKLRSELKSNHELPEKTFDDILNSSNQDLSFDCDVFKNTTYYRQIEGELSGLDKCIKDCDGKCLSYGHTGSAWCFHKNK